MTMTQTVTDMPKRRILLVDDETKVALVLARGLKTLGQSYQIDTAHSGTEALTKLNSATYDLLITDYQMPTMTGLDLTQAAKSLDPELRVVVMTAYGTANLRETIKALRINGYIEKPFTLAQLRQTIKQCLGQGASRQSTADYLLSYQDGHRTGDKETSAHSLSFAGLCATCQYVQTVTSGRNSIFVLCGLAKTDKRFSKYPPLPMMACKGYVETSRATLQDNEEKIS